MRSCGRRLARPPISDRRPTGAGLGRPPAGRSRPAVLVSDSPAGPRPIRLTPPGRGSTPRRWPPPPGSGQVGWRRGFPRPPRRSSVWAERAQPEAHSFFSPDYTALADASSKAVLMTPPAMPSGLPVGFGAVLSGCGPHEHRTPASVQKLLLAAALMPRLDAKQVVEVKREDLADLDPASSVMGLVEGGRYSSRPSGWDFSSDPETTQSTSWAASAAGRPAARASRRDERGGTPAAREPDPCGDAVRIERPRTTAARLLPRAHRPRLFRLGGLPAIARDPGGTGTGPARKASLARSSTTRPCWTAFPGMLGGKAGFTQLARQTYVGVVERNGRELVVTLLGAAERNRTSGARTRKAAPMRLLPTAFPSQRIR